MAFDLTQIRDLITRVIMAQELYSESAVNLLLGTMAVESDFGTFLYQVGGGPACGVFQIEINTELDIWVNYLRFRHARRVAIMKITGIFSTANNGALEWNLAYAICMARLVYRRIKEPFPDSGDIEGLAQYWKMYYNTQVGSGTVNGFISKYNKYIVVS